MDTILEAQDANTPDKLCYAVRWMETHLGYLPNISLCADGLEEDDSRHVTIRDIITGRRWTHIGGAKPAWQGQRDRGERNAALNSQRTMCVRRGVFMKRAALPLPR